MINDSVREDLIGKVSVAKPNNFEAEINTMNNPMPIAKTAASAQNSIDEKRVVTSELISPPTNPTLVEFHSKTATLPEWRLQLQNAVRQRQDRETHEEESAIQDLPPVKAARARLVTSGATALKVEVIETPKPIAPNNPNLARALERIESSRRKFLVEEKPQPAPAPSVAKGNKNYPFYLAAKTADVAVVRPAEINAPVNSYAKPTLAPTLRTEKRKLDTNKLPPLTKSVEVIESFEAETTIVSETLKTTIVETEKVEIGLAETVETIENNETKIEEMDDCAPFATRFNAGLFDLIIGSFTSLILLAPFIFLGGNWASTAGIFAFLVTCSVVMFIYLTTSIGLHGRTLGMRLFSIEVVDIESADYPSFHQAAVSSAVYLLSLALGGIGFLTLPFNEDKRAVHDLVSGTVIVREEI